VWLFPRASKAKLYFAVLSFKETLIVFACSVELCFCLSLFLLKQKQSYAEKATLSTHARVFLLKQKQHPKRSNRFRQLTLSLKAS
jgi:hypothetical protein